MMPLGDSFAGIPNALFFPIALGLFVAAIVYIALMAEKKRREAFRKVAMRLGLGFEPKPLAPPDITAFSIFTKGSGKKARNRIHGSRRGRKLSIFDYSFTTGGGKSSSTQSQTLYLVGLEKEIPAFTMGPEGFFSKLAELFGSKDIDFPDDEPFSKKYLLQSEDEDGVRRLFTPTLRSFFSQEAPFTIECNGTELLVYRMGRRTAPEDIQAMLATVDRIRSQLEAEAF